MKIKEYHLNHDSCINEAKFNLISNFKLLNIICLRFIMNFITSTSRSFYKNKNHVPDNIGKLWLLLIYEFMSLLKILDFNHSYEF